MYDPITSTKQVSGVIHFLTYAKIRVKFATFLPLNRYRKLNFRMSCCEKLFYFDTFFAKNLFHPFSFRVR